MRDSVEAISREVKAASEACDIVLTAGGVGPTLDDVTMAAVADAFGVALGCHAELEHRIRAYFEGNVTQAHLKMAEAPTGAFAGVGGTVQGGVVGGGWAGGCERRGGGRVGWWGRGCKELAVLTAL